MQAARDVERQHRAALAVDVFDEARVVAFDVACEADAEEAVDHQPPRFVLGELGGVEQRDAEKLLPQEPGHDFGVAAVVAGTGEDEDVLLLVGGEPGGELGGRGAGALHERRFHLAGFAFDAPDIVR